LVSALAEAARAEAAMRKRLGLHPLILLAALVGYHVNVPLPIGTAVFPYVLAAPPMALLILVNIQYVDKRVVRPLAALFLFNAASAAYVLFFTRSPIGPPLVDLGQFLYTATLGYGLYLEVARWPRAYLHQWAGILAVTFLSLATIEFLTPLKDIDTWFFNEFYTWGYGYSSDQALQIRDTFEFGGFRPRVFASEPSMAGMTGAMLQIVWWATVEKWDNTRRAFGYLMAVASLLVVRSPFAITPVIYGMSLWLFARPTASNTNGRAFAMVRFGAFLAVAVMLMFGLGYLLTVVLPERAHDLASGQDLSTAMRTYDTAGWRVGLAHPVFGAGIANFNYVQSTMAEAFLEMGAPPQLAFSDVMRRSINNAFGATLLFYGFIGSFVFIALLLWMLKTLMPRSTTSERLTFLVLVSITTGTVYGPMFFWPLFLMAGARNAVSIVPVPRRARQPLPPHSAITATARAS
jgi:hypothetical protein